MDVVAFNSVFKESNKLKIDFKFRNFIKFTISTQKKYASYQGYQIHTELYVQYKIYFLLKIMFKCASLNVNKLIENILRNTRND